MVLNMCSCTILNSIRCNMRQSFRTRNLVTVNFYRLKSKTLTISNPTVQRRSYYWVSGLLGKQSEITLKHMDKVPNEIKMIYRNDDVDVHLKWIYFAVCIVAGAITGITFFKYDTVTRKILMNDEEVTLRYDYVMSYFFFILCFITFHACMKRMPVRIYKIPKEKRYIFVFQSSIPFTTRKLPCKRGECTRVDPETLPSFMAYKDIYRIGNIQTVFMFDHAFKKPADRHVLLGVQEDYED